jgi:hypothetical protein
MVSGDHLNQFDRVTITRLSFFLIIQRKQCHNFDYCQWKNKICLSVLLDKYIINKVTTRDMDIDGLFNSVVGAFLGFGLALIVQAIATFYVNQKMMKRTISNLTSEIKIIYDDLLINKERKSKAFYDIPMWETVMSAGNFLHFIKKNYYGEIIQFYSTISYLNKIEGVENIEKVIEKRKEVLNLANNVLKKMGEIT